MVEYAPLFRLHARASWHFYERSLYPCGIVSPPSFWARRSRAKPKHRIFLSQKPSGGTFLTVKDAVKNQKCKYLLSFFAVQPRIKQKISMHKAHNLLYDTLCKKEHKHRGVLLSENLKMPLSASTAFVRSNANGLSPNPYTWTPKAHASLRGTPTQAEKGKDKRI